MVKKSEWVGSCRKTDWIHCSMLMVKEQRGNSMFGFER